MLDPDILTIGFARRVASYKRLTLMLSDPARLKALLLHPEHPIQLVIAGKAPSEIEKLVAQALAAHYVRNPQVTVNLKETISQVVTMIVWTTMNFQLPMNPVIASANSGVPSAGRVMALTFDSQPASPARRATAPTVTPRIAANIICACAMSVSARRA